MLGVIAHRGARSLAPENTLAAFRRAQSLPVQMVEGDVAITKDGVPVMIHQETLEPSKDFKRLQLAARNEARGWVSEHTWSEIKDIDSGSWFSECFLSQRIPTLQEVLNLGWTDKTLLLDLIDPQYWVDPSNIRVVEQFKSFVIPMLRQAHSKGAAISVLAFNPAMLELFLRELPAIQRTLAIWTNQRGNETWIEQKARELQITTLTIADFMLRDEPSWAALAKRNGFKLGVFELTPDSHADFKTWTPEQRKKVWDLVLAEKVDWFTSDFPAEFVDYRDSR